MTISFTSPDFKKNYTTKIARRRRRIERLAHWRTSEVACITRQLITPTLAAPIDKRVVVIAGCRRVLISSIYAVPRRRDVMSDLDSRDVRMHTVTVT